jgi:hypothetical protein
LFSIKDKLAYATALVATDTTNENNTTQISEQDVKDKLNSVMCKLETDLLNKQEFTESRIIRHSAINRFECKLDTKERANLNVFAIEVKKLCSNE